MSHRMPPPGDRSHSHPSRPLTISTWSAAIPFGVVVFAILPSVWLGQAWYTRQRSPWLSVASMVGHILLTAAVTVVAILMAP